MALLVVLPVLVFGLPALLGHTVVPGDDLTQNYPLRVLAGHQISAGHLPLFDPYIWGGAPLLAGWNAGAAYPLTLLFAVMPGASAWTLNLIATWAVAGLGMFWFLRALRLGTLASFLGALTFAFAGAMPAQVGHFGLVAGMSWVPLELLAVLRLTESRSRSSNLQWACVLAVAFGLTILAGEPRSIDDACVVVFIYAGWRLARGPRRFGPAIWIAAGLGLGICLGAVQWLPGLAAVSTSQRAASSIALFSSGSMPPRWLLLLFVPDLLGGSGSFGQPAFFASYNLAEVTSYVGILPLVAATAMLGRLRLRARPPEWVVWHVIALVGLVCALGAKTPLGHLLIHLPLFGNQRLQSRNIIVLDLALAVLLGYWADDPFGAKSRVDAPQSLVDAPQSRARVALQSWLGVLPALIVIVIATVGIVWPSGMLGWLGVPKGSNGVYPGIVPGLVPYALLGVAAAGIVILGPHLPLGLSSRLLAGFVAADVIVFTMLAVVAVGASPGTAIPVGPVRANPATGPPTAATRPIAALGYRGRFAIYDPDLLDTGQLEALRAPDLNVITGTPSVQGYSSIVDGRYATSTGSHRSTGAGQNVLAPRAISDGTLAELDTSVLLTLPQYLVTAADRDGPAPGPAGTGQRDIAAGQHATWYLGGQLNVAKLQVPDSAATRDAANGTQIGLMAPGGSTRWFQATAVGGTLLAIDPPAPVEAIAVIAHRDGSPLRLGPPAIVTADGSRFLANGQLQDALAPPQWGYAANDGPFAEFVDHGARGALAMAGLSGRSAAGASVTAISGSADEAEAASVQSTSGVRILRSVAAIPGWTATWHPLRGPSTELAVHRAGVVQSVDVPAGRGIVTWSYDPPGFDVGLALSLAAAAVTIALLLVARRTQGGITRPDAPT